MAGGVLGVGRGWKVWPLIEEDLCTFSSGRS